MAFAVSPSLPIPPMPFLVNSSLLTLPRIRLS
jgi:hypothetical protein